MPLITFTVNTNYLSNVPHIPLGMDVDGSFKLSKRLEYIPPKETIFRLKRVFYDGGGQLGESGGVNGGRNKTPVVWMGLEFPQMEEIIHSDIKKETVDGTYRTKFEDPEVATRTVNDFGILRFPLKTFPISGAVAAATNPNSVDRQRNSVDGEKFEHKCNHDMDIPLGRMNLENGFLECILTPRERDAKLPIEMRGTLRLCRIRQIQVILEYN